ncbi:MAG: serine hydroxymethyltransferase [Candidatus Diapherotrites archaeon]|nr:serine hydroxymethyltransferase [Candidatus Diapherotrites archaeon]
MTSNFNSRFSIPLQQSDNAVYACIQKEFERQQEVLELIPSESLPSKAVLEALGSVLNNKYSEGYPGKRYYGGNHVIDQVESIAIERCKQLFGCEYANVQPYSGSPANAAVYLSVLNYGDKFMGMNLAHGGHLTHGHKLNFSGKSYSIVSYGVDKETERLDYDAIKRLALQEKPKIIVSGSSAYPREIDFKAFAEIAQEVGAVSMSDISHIAGLIAGNVHPSPFPFTDIVTSTTHKTLCGPRGAVIMARAQFGEAIDKAVFPGIQGGPHNHQIAAKAVAFGEALRPEFKAFAGQIVKNAKALGTGLMEGGLRLVSGGTDNHLCLVDLTQTPLTGKEAEALLDTVNITVNKNMIPFDPRKPLDPSGIRVGTPTLTGRGFNEEACREVGQLIAKAVFNSQDASLLDRVRAEVKTLTQAHPIYPMLKEENAPI